MVKALIRNKKPLLFQKQGLFYTHFCIDQRVFSTYRIGIMDYNALINIALLATTVWLSVSVSPWFLLLPIIFHAINDLCHWLIGKTIFNEDKLVQRCYQAVDDFLSDQHGEGLDLGFNFYNGDFSKPRKQAQQEKWDFVISQLGLQAGDRLIDVGCGYGDWINYAKSKGIHVRGINLTKEQADFAKKNYGIDVVNTNWKNVLVDSALQQELFGKFDAVTFMDTIEHYVPPTARHKPDVQNQIYTDMFKLANQLLDSQSRVGRVFLSCLHQEEKPLDFHRYISKFLMDRTMCGFYPIGDQGLSKNAVSYFNEIKRFDETENYRITAVVEPEHFQTNHNVRMNLKRFLLGLKWLVVDPYFVHRLLGIVADHWMSFFGEDPYAKEYNPEKRSKLTYVRLWMILFEKKRV